MKNIICLTIMCSLFFAAGCGGSGSSSSGSSTVSAFNLPNEAAKSVPQIYNSITASISPKSPVYVGYKGDLTEAELQIVENFFKLECHTDNGSLNFCPDGVDDTSLATKFSATTLIGLIQHADMYMANIYTPDDVPDPVTGESVSTPTYKTCGKGTDPAELTNHTPVYDPENSSTFVVDFGNLFDCVGSFSFSGDDTSYALYSKSDDNLVFASLTARKQIESTVDYAGVMSDIFQSYVRRNSSGDPVILAFNLASFDEKGENDSAGRAVLITNFEENKFVAKYVAGTDTSNYSQIVAIGKAGYDPDESTWIDGYYSVRADYGNEASNTSCIQNGETPAVVDGMNCADVSNFFSVEGWTMDQLYSYLGASSEDQANLSGFESFFNNVDFLSTEATVLPANGTDYFPDSISK